MKRTSGAKAVSAGAQALSSDPAVQIRLTGPLRIEVHQAGKPMRIAHPGTDLEAPGILANPIPVEALYDSKVSDEVSFRNLLQRHGYASLDAVRAEGEARGEARGEAAGLREAILDVFAARELTVGEDVQAMLAGCQDLALLRRWHRQAITAASPSDLAR